MARLSTHVLDIARGVPAEGVKLELRLLGGDSAMKASTRTNRDGRTDQPLLAGEALETGIYEITFYAGDYLRALGLTLPDPPFLDRIVIRFGIADPRGDYHVPLLLSPFGYSTYRGA
jgi:5-hydroxyisourate hydrolase